MHGLNAHRRQGAAYVREANPCRAEQSALVGKNSGTVPPAGTAQHPESNAASCAALLRDCQAHSSARMGTTSPGEPRPFAHICILYNTR